MQCVKWSLCHQHFLEAVGDDFREIYKRLQTRDNRNRKKWGGGMMNHTHTQKVFSIFLKTQSPSPGRCFSHTLDMNPPGETINRWPNNRARVSATQRAPTASESKRNAPFPFFFFFCLNSLSAWNISGKREHQYLLITNSTLNCVRLSLSLSVAFS